MRRVGEDDALDRRVRDVALVPQRDVLEPGLQVAAQHPGEPAELLALHRVALVRHRARALLGARRGTAPRPRATSVRCRWRISSANASIARADRRARVEELGVAVAGEHLRGRHRARARGARTRTPRPRDRRSSRCRPRPRACRPRSRRGPGASRSTVAAHLQRPERELGAERRRLGVDAVRAADHRRVAELAGPGGDRRPRARSAASRSRSAARVERERQRGVDDVARREAVVDPGPRGLADALLHDVDERGDVVLGDLLALVDGGRRRTDARARGRRRRRRRGRRPSSAQASTARISTSSQAPSRASSVNSSAISGRA